MVVTGAVVTVTGCHELSSTVTSCPGRQRRPVDDDRSEVHAERSDGRCYILM